MPWNSHVLPQEYATYPPRHNEENADLPSEDLRRSSAATSVKRLSANDSARPGKAECEAARSAARLDGFEPFGRTETFGNLLRRGDSLIIYPSAVKRCVSSISRRHLDYSLAKCRRLVMTSPWRANPTMASTPTAPSKMPPLSRFSGMCGAPAPSLSRRCVDQPSQVKTIVMSISCRVSFPGVPCRPSPLGREMLTPLNWSFEPRTTYI